MWQGRKVFKYWFDIICHTKKVLFQPIGIIYFNFIELFLNLSRDEINLVFSRIFFVKKKCNSLGKSLIVKNTTFYEAEFHGKIS